MVKQQVNMRVICVDPIRVCMEYETLQFGLQDKKGILQPGFELSPDEIVFDFTLTLQKQRDGSANFTGAFAHGPRAKRFIYLTYKGFDGESWRIFRRIKVALGEISWSQARAAVSSGSVLQARVSGLVSGTVPLLDEGWQLLS